MVADGVNPEAFWEMTFGEVGRVQTEIVKRRNIELAHQAAIAYTLADLIKLGVGNMLSKSQQHYPSRSEAFPGLFDDVEVEQDWTMMRDNFHDAFGKRT